MVRIGSLIVAAAMLAFAGAAAAQEPQRPRAVIELFTSQGCSSCPPADRILSDLAREPGIIALSLPVDYWDYLGWKDTLADPAHSARQRDYAKARGERQVFTPQAVINGSLACIGSHRAKIDRYLAKAYDKGLALSVPVALSEKNDKLVIEVGEAEGDIPRMADLWAFAVAPSRDVKIGRGENHDREITYVNVVRGIKRLGGWTGTKLKLETPLAAIRQADAETYVVLLQAAGEGAPGRILGAAKGPGL